MINNYIEERAEKLLQEANCLKAPIDINKCAQHLKVEVNPLELDENVSGFFVIKENKAHIGYNKNDNDKRTRFTIAHELGHFVLHAKQIPLFIDKYETKLYRDFSSTTGESIMEREANAFAAALLMPRKLILKELEEDNNKSNIIKRLSQKFNVSIQAMGIRLVNLEILDY